MSAWSLVTVFCDGCGRWESTADTAREARAQLKGTGWKLAVVDERTVSRRDYCPTCVQEGRTRPQSSVDSQRGLA